MLEKENEIILQVKDLKVAYLNNHRLINVLKGISFTLKRGEILSVLGESGSGKSTIARTITGLLPPSAHIEDGTLRIGSAFTEYLPSKIIDWNQIRGKKISMLFQDAQQALNPMLRIKEHFRETLLYHRIVPDLEVFSISRKLLTILNFTDIKSIMDSYPFQLSGGMCQRICLALSLCLNPLVLIADEPTSALDTVNQKEALDLLRRLQKELGLAVLLITHDMAVANSISNRVVVLNEGIIEEQGDTWRVFSDPKTAYTRELISSRILGEKFTQDNGALRRSTPVLEIMDLKKTFIQKKNVLCDLNFTLYEREILGILGESGCGKSTLARCITNLEHPNQGRITYRGTNIAMLRGNEKRKVCKHIQMVFQDARASLNPRHTALQLVEEPLHYMRIAQKKEREAMANYYLNEVGICDDVQKRKSPQLSTGQCQRVAIARALVLEPEILICDEALSALDMKVQAQMLELLYRLHKQFGFSILMISHDIRILRNFCHRIAVMKEGNFCEVRQVNTLFNESNESYTQLLLKCERDMETGFCCIE